MPVPQFNFGSQWALNAHGGDQPFPDPFCDYASTVMPETIAEAHAWGEFVVNNNGVYRSALERVLSYFITELEIGDEDVGDDEKDKWKTFLNDTIDIKQVCHDYALNFLTYGIGIGSLEVPFTRSLYCPKCYYEAPLGKIARDPSFNFTWSNYEFRATCAHGRNLDGKTCKYTGPWERIDRRTTNPEELKFKIWSPKEVDVVEDPKSKDCLYLWRLPEKYKRLVRGGSGLHGGAYLHVLERADWELVECVRDNLNLEFSDDVLFVLKEKSLAGHDMGGWGASRILSNFRQAWYVQVLHRFNEAIAMDYVVPFRVLTPPPSGATEGAIDPIANMDAGDFVSQVLAMYNLRKLDPTRIFALPFPIEYKALGGEAKNLAPYELMDQGISLLLNNIGVPAELHKGNLQTQAAPAALRLFEATWGHLVHGMNKLIQFVVEAAARALGWDPIQAKLSRVTIIDDLQEQQAKLQLMIGRQISQTTGLGAMGIDFRQEQRRILEEERYVQEQQAKMQTEMEQAAMMEQMAAPPPPPAAPGMPPGAAPPGGAPAPGAAPPVPGTGAPAAGPAGVAAQGFSVDQVIHPGQKVTPQELMEKAQVIAQQMMQVPQGQRQAEMSKLKQRNPTIHSLVKATIDDMRQQARTQGASMVLQQQGMQP